MALLRRNLAAGLCCDVADALKPTVQFSGYGKTCRIRNRKTPKYTITVCQRTRRGSWKSIPLLWKTLTSTQKNNWKTLALSIPFLNKCNQPNFLSAYQMFCKVNGVLLNFGELYLLPSAPPNWNPPLLPLSYSKKWIEMPYSDYKLRAMNFLYEDLKGLQLFSMKGWGIPPSKFYIKARLIYSGVNDHDPLGALPDMSTVASWSSPPVEYGIMSLCYDGTFIYSGMGALDGRIFKINPITMECVAIKPGFFEGWGCTALAHDSSFLYAGYYSDRARVKKINPTHLTDVDIWIGGDEDLYCSSLCYDGAFIYSGMYYGKNGVTQIDPETMSTYGHLPNLTGPYYVRALAVGSPPFIYAGLELHPGIVLKINTITMTVVGEYAYSGWASCRALLYYNNFLFVGYNTSPAVVVKIDPETMTYCEHWLGAPGENNVSSLTCDLNYIYAGLWMAPGKVVKIDHLSMVSVAVWTEPSFWPLIQALTSDQTFTYAGSPNNPAKISKISPAMDGINIGLRHAWKTGYGRQYGNCPIFPSTEYKRAINSILSKPKCTLLFRTVSLFTGNYLSEKIEELAVE